MHIFIAHLESAEIDIFRFCCICSSWPKMDPDDCLKVVFMCFVVAYCGFWWFMVFCGVLWCVLWCFVMFCGVLWWFVVFSVTRLNASEGLFSSKAPELLFSCKTVKLLIVLLNQDIHCLYKQCRSWSFGFRRSQLIGICIFCHSVVQFISTVWIKKSDWLTIRSGSGILINSEWQGLICKQWSFWMIIH